MNVKKGFFGWKLLAIAFFLYICIWDFSVYGIGIVGKYMLEALKITKADIGIAGSIGAIVGGIVSFAASWLVRKKSIKLSIIIGSFIVTISSVVMATMVKSALGLFIWGGFMLGSGIALASAVPCMMAITNWFERKRSLAMSIYLLGGGVGGMFIPPVTNALINKYGGWQAGWWFSAALGAAGFILSFFIIDKPSDIGQIPDGPIKKETTAKARNIKVYQTKDEFTMREVLKCPSLYIILLSGAGLNFFMGLFFVHNVIHLTSLGLPTALAAVSLSIFALISMCARLFGGIIGDFIEQRYSMAIALIVLALGALIGIHPANAGMVYIYSIIAGLGFGLTYIGAVVIMPNYFGRKAYSTIVAITAMVGVLFNAFAQVSAGVIAGKTGAYTLAFIISGAISAVAGIAMLVAKPPKKVMQQDTVSEKS